MGRLSRVKWTLHHLKYKSASRLKLIPNVTFSPALLVARVFNCNVNYKLALAICLARSKSSEGVERANGVWSGEKGPEGKAAFQS